MKFYLFKDEELELEVTDPKIFNEAYGVKRGTDYSVYQMETTVSNFQPFENRDDPEQKQICEDVMEKLRQLVKSPAVRNVVDNGVAGTAKKRRMERNPTLKIHMAVPNNRGKAFNNSNSKRKTILEIDGEFITALHQMCRPLPNANADVSVKVSLLITDLLSSPPDAICKPIDFSVMSEDTPIVKTDDYAEYCGFEFYMTNNVRIPLLITSKDGKKFSKIGGKFTIEICLHNFIEETESVVSLNSMNQTILNETDSADVVILTGDDKKVLCHRNFLTVNSVVLKDMLRSSSVHFQESPRKIEMPDMSEEGVKAFLAYLYYRDLAPAKEKISIVRELLEAAEKYKVIPLRTSMEKILLEIHEDSWWTVEPALQIFAFMIKIDTDVKKDVKEDVKKKIIQVLKRNSDEWMSCEGYQKILKKNPTLNSELLRISLSLLS